MDGWTVLLLLCLATVSIFARKVSDKMDLMELEPWIFDDDIDEAGPAHQNFRSCQEVECQVGQDCYIDEDTGEAACECVRECMPEQEDRRRVCTNHNETFNSDCELHQLLCYCLHGDRERCPDPAKYEHVHIEYYGGCRIIPQCSSDDLQDFPRRMREWLFNIMKELTERRELSYHYQIMEMEAEADLNKRWTNAAIWKWCDLDGAPKDNSVSRHELFLLKAPLQTLEHCIGDFLNSCDLDENQLITLKEWGECLKIPISEMEERCEMVRLS